jgi:OOP family OmpA-OmpF porin
MESSARKYRDAVISILIGLMMLCGYAQSEMSKWKYQMSFGINFPENTGFVNPYEPRPLNFPTINLGVQHMFTGQYGAKLDLGYNRFSNADNTPDFKTNYTRLNMQFVFDATKSFNFLPSHTGVVWHAGPGLSFMKPLGSFTQNKQTYVNILAGIELHYGLTKTVSVFSDFSYAYGLAGDKTYDPPRNGFGVFRGNLFTISLGISVSLSGCQYCD